MLSNDYAILNQPNEAVDCEPIGAVRDSFDLARNKICGVYGARSMLTKLESHTCLLSGGILTQIFNS
jgi:hypothetical protein